MAKRANRRGYTLPRFILDAPATADDLGAHGRLASVIAHVVRYDDRIKTIGILGGWGSGKSTVAGLVEQNLRSDSAAPKIYCFTYDAWLHQSDPPRRAFLESLLAYLENESEFQDIKAHQDKWNKTLKKFDGDQRETKTTVTPTLTGAGRWYVFTIPLVPVGLKLMSDSTIAFNARIDPVGLAGWLLAFSPLIAAVMIYVWWRPKASIFTGKFWKTHRKPYEEESILSVIANKHVEVKDELATGHAEPTAIEFQDIFREIMARAQTTKRRLVIVVDNLDRLPPDDAQSFWATVRSFFLGSEGGSVRPDRKCLPTVLVPIDNLAFSRMYDHEKEKAQASDGIFSVSFLEKTFDLVFHVPVPVLSKWHKYLRDRLRSVFGGEMPTYWPHAVGTVYEAWLAGKGFRATPRSINAFVNSIAVAWIESKPEDIHIGVIAYYVTNRSELSEDIYAAVRSPNPLLDNFDEEWRLSVAALHFGVSREDAKEIFMVGPIRSAITNRATDEFKQLADVPGFERYFLRLLDAVATEGEPPSAMAAAALLQSLPDQQEAWVSEAWRKVRHLSITTLKAVPYKPGDASGLQAMFSSCDQPERILFIKAIAKAFESLAPEAVQHAHGAPFSEAASLIIEQAVKDGLEDFKLSVPGGPSEFATILLQDLPPATTRRLVPQNGTIESVLKYLSEGFSDILAAPAIGKAAISLAKRSASEIEWTPLIDAIAEALAGDELVRVSQAASAMKGLYPFVEDVSVRIATLQGDGTLTGAFDIAWQADAEQEIADIASLIVITGEELKVPDSDWESKLATAPEVPRLLIESLQSLGRRVNFPWLVERLKAHPAERPLLRAIAARLLTPDSRIDLSAKAVFDDLDNYANVLSPELASKFWGLVSCLDGFWAAQHGLPNAVAAPLLRAIIHSDVNKSQLGKALQKRLHETAQEEWSAAVRDGAEPFGLVESLDDLERSNVTVGPNADAELRTLIPELLETLDENLRSRWFRVAFRLSEDTRKTLFRILRDRLVSGVPITNLPSLLTIGGAALLRDGEFTRRPEPVALHLMLPLIDSEEGRNWLLQNADEASFWFRRSKKETKTSIMEQLGRLRDHGEAGAEELMNGLQGR